MQVVIDIPGLLAGRPDQTLQRVAELLLPAGLRRTWAITVAATMAEAAQAWLGQLNGDQRPIAVGQVPSDAGTDGERRRWFYTPTDHGGLTLHQQRPAQQRAAMRLVATGLSRPGYVTVATTMGLENILDHTEGFVPRCAALLPGAGPAPAHRVGQHPAGREPRTLRLA